MSAAPAGVSYVTMVVVAAEVTTAVIAVSLEAEPEAVETVAFTARLKKNHVVLSLVFFFFL